MALCMQSDTAEKVLIIKKKKKVLLLSFYLSLRSVFSRGVVLARDASLSPPSLVGT